MTIEIPHRLSEFPVSALTSDVELILDQWGIPHIYAQSASDAFVAQGFNAARDRLFQMEMLRRRGHGRLAEILGPAFVDQDRASRLLLFRGDMSSEWAGYGAGAKSIVDAFVSGVNSFITWALATPGALSPEFELYAFTPEHWTSDDIVRVRTHGLLYNVENEVARAQALREFGAEVEELRYARESGGPIVVPDGLDLSLIDDSILTTYRLAFSPVNYEGAAHVDPSTGGGSNAWVVSSERTHTGRPILANDPHRGVTMPSLRYIAHLDAPGLSVIGGGEPSLPGVSIGHNGSVAFGLTIWGADQEDLYLYELDPTDSGRYKYLGAWEPFRIVTEAVSVKGAAPVTTDLQFTRHGPVIHLDEAKGFAAALRAVWLEPGTSPYLGSLQYLRATTANDFLGGLERWGTPGVNQIFATADGDIGWQGSALVPIRPNWDGSLPVPGDGRYEWAGMVNAASLPRSVNPDCGWIASANEMNIPEDFDASGPTVTVDWHSAGRYDRLAQWLGSDDQVSIFSSTTMQADSLNLHAARVIDALRPVNREDLHDPAEFRSLLDWDADERSDSFEALLFEIWLRRHFRTMLAIGHLRSVGLDESQIHGALKHVLRDESRGGDLRADIRMLEAIDWTDTGRASEMAAMVDSTMRSALEEIEALLGPDRETWTWGALHHTLLVNPALDGVTQAPMNWKRVGPAPRPGSGDTVGMASYDSQFRQVVGSSFRIAIDVGDWDESRAMNAPGQSGDPRSPHYQDLFDSWVRSESFPLAFSREAVQRHAERTIWLRAVEPTHSAT